MPLVYLTALAHPYENEARLVASWAHTLTTRLLALVHALPYGRLAPKVASISGKTSLCRCCSIQTSSIEPSSQLYYDGVGGEVEVEVEDADDDDDDDVGTSE